MNETQIYWDKGANDPTQNQRLVNHTRIAQAAPEIVPQIIDTTESKENRFPVEKITGYVFSNFIESSEYQVGDEEKVEISIEDKISVTKKILEQMRVLLDKYGVVIADRNGGNILIVHNKDSAKQKWTIKQVDLAIVYDAVADTNYVANSVDLLKRSTQEGQLVIKDQAHLDKWLSGNVVALLSQLTYSKKFYNELDANKRALVDDFKKTWSFSGRERNGSRILQIDDAVSFLNSLI